MSVIANQPKKFIRQVIYDDYYHIDPDGRTEHVGT